MATVTASPMMMMIVAPGGQPQQRQRRQLLLHAVVVTVCVLLLLLMDVERFPFQLSKKACPTAPNGILCLMPDTLIRQNV